jgi:hypothetical protein
MLKNILNLEGAQKLTINELKSIGGGDDLTCPRADSNGCFSGPYYCPNPRNLPTCVKKSHLL